MSNTLVTRFHAHQSLLVKSTSVSHFIILNQKVAQYDGYVRIRAELVDSGLLEFTEYIEMDKDGQLIDYIYSFHWQDNQQQLVRRWDNADHYPQLPHAPHHIHQADGTVEGNPELPTLAFVLTVIEKQIT